MKKCYDYLSKRIYDSKHEHPSTIQSDNDIQDEIENDRKYLQNIELEQEIMRRTGIELKEKFEIITQEFVEMKRKMAVYEKSRNQSYGTNMKKGQRNVCDID